MLSIQLRCDACQWWTLCGEAEIVRRLRMLGLLRRASDPPEDVVRELLASYGPQLTCDRCGTAELTLGEPGDDEGGDWQQAVVCEACRQPIDPERLEFNPAATRCVACQDAEDRGQTPVEVDYCPKCGAILELRTSRGGGITRYKLFCTGSPPCRV